MTVTLSDLPFIYIYFRPDSIEDSLYRSKERGQSLSNRLVPKEFLPVMKRLKETIEAKGSNLSEGLFTFENVRCRFSQQKMADGSTWFCIRRIETEIPRLSDLGFAPHISSHLHSLGQRQGLIIIAGPSAQGKTMTAAALLADCLTSYGGTAVAIESPIEYNLHGRHGEFGQCFQTEPSSDEDWEVCLKRALSWSPNYIFAGEVRTPRVAELLLRAATTGHTIITTVNAGTPEDALIEVLFLAERSMGPSSNNIMAQGLTALLFQTMKEEGPFIRYLFTEENAPGDPIRTLVREGKVTMISTYIDRIAARLSNQPQPLPPLSKTTHTSSMPPKKF